MPTRNQTRKNGAKKMKGMGDDVMLLILCFVSESGEAFIIVIIVFDVINLVIFLSKAILPPRQGK